MAPGPGRSGYLFVGGYAAALVLLGVVPVGYALRLAFTSSGGGLTGDNFVLAWHDGFAVPAFEHVGEFLVLWLAAMVVLVVALALVLHNVARPVGGVLRLLFYLPGAFAGAASVTIWLLLLDPRTSPVSFLLHLLGYRQLLDTLAASHVPFILAVMAFWSGAGGWILVMHGALEAIPRELGEAAALDGAGALATALRIKLPLIKRWVGFMVILCFAAGTQLFVEPQVLAEANPRFTNNPGFVSDLWSPLQVAYQLAFTYDNFNEAASISVVLLAVGLLAGMLVVWRGKLFEIDE